MTAHMEQEEAGLFKLADDVLGEADKAALKEGLDSTAMTKALARVIGCEASQRT